ncbi:hypothetical protein DFJ77DRAFT_346740 [Powellomyces hirtus]|nr:hypothetical protein DFJ77DRAFT_346740 [Powellomyces hirtus]
MDRHAIESLARQFSAASRSFLLVTSTQNSNSKAWLPDLPGTETKNRHHHHHQPVRIAVLAASFNPPTLAHSRLLQNAVTSSPSLSESPDNTTQPLKFDAHLLLFSTSNPDKQLSGASIPERLLMMQALAKDLSAHTADAPVGVGIISVGKFLEKAVVIHEHLSAQQQPSLLYFVMGFDTITRFFDPKYYANVDMAAEMERFFASSRIMCADRPAADGNGPADGLHDWIDREAKSNPIVCRFRQHVILLPQWADTCQETAHISSTRVRSLLAAYNSAKAQKSKEKLESVDREILELIPLPVWECIQDNHIYEQP